MAQMAQMVQNGPKVPKWPRMFDLVKVGPEQSKWPKMAQKGVPTICAGKFRKKLFLGTPCIFVYLCNLKEILEEILEEITFV